jgi:glycosyltransferase involved in cell wall biosynthesis
MKLLVFAHTPPPHHGQSYMVQLMLNGFGGDKRRRKHLNTDSFKARTESDGGYNIDCYHVNVQLSQKLEDIGDMRAGKFILLLGYCVQAIWFRFRYGVKTFYYIPAPGKPSALYRDWLVMLLCRPFFSKVILHWHAAGLAKWLETVAQSRTRALTYRFLKQVDLSIVLSRFNRADAEKIFSRNITVVSNGVPDPCTDFDKALLPRRRARFAARKKLLSGKPLEEQDLRDTGENPSVVRVLYLAHCTRDKGLFDTLSGMALANQRLKERHFPVSLRLVVAGTFVSEQEREEFDRICAVPEMKDLVHYEGFVSGDKKTQLLREADLFCFPTCYENENQPVNLIEAMAFGLPILTTRWRSLPELFPIDYPGLVDIRSPEQVANVMPALMTGEAGDGFREIFLRHYTIEKYLSGLAEAFKRIDSASPVLSARPSAQAARG